MRKAARMGTAARLRIVPPIAPPDDTHSLEAQLARLQREQRELHRALFEAAEVQRRLCPPRQLRHGRFEIACEMFPLSYLSGDFYDVLDLGSATGLAVGDIVGKGLAAGMWFAHLLGQLRVQGRSSTDPAKVVAGINHDLRQLKAEPPLVSLFFARLDPKRGELAYCNAGQPPALLLKADGSTRPLAEGGPLLGAIPQAAFVSGRVSFEPGDTLVVYSDGIVECRNAAGDEFGLARLEAAVRYAAGLSRSSRAESREVAQSATRDAPSANKLLFSLLGAVQDFAGPTPREDDFALLVVPSLD
ncbi:MAG: PP2C family protein-serine/threonine phosphatase [Candidatus Acidiferrales bacterium]